jgi:hypothetical protein
MYQVLLNIGRLQGGNNRVTVPNLGEEVLIKAAQKYWATHPSPAGLATQVLIWEDSEPQNLIAVYTPSLGGLTIMP